MTYPKRPRFFANRYVRLMAKSCLAQTVGPEACWLITVIVFVEDAKGYRGAVTFFNEQLMPMAGFGSVDSLARARAKAVASGWLHYSPGGKGRAGTYWVKIPDEFLDYDDRPSDESEDVAYLRNRAEVSAEVSADHPQICGENRETTERKVRREPRDNREESAEHSSYTSSVPLSNKEVCGPTEPEKPKRKPREAFVIPTVEEVSAYCLERGNEIDAERFVDFYSAKGWMIGKNKIKDWKACVRTWEKSEQPKGKEPEAPIKQSVLSKFECDHGTYDPTGRIPFQYNTRLCRDLNCPACKPKREAQQ